MRYEITVEPNEYPLNCTFSGDLTRWEVSEPDRAMTKRQLVELLQGVPDDATFWIVRVGGCDPLAVVDVADHLVYVQ